MNWCKRCVYPEVAVDFSFNDEGICSGCLNKDEIKNIDWDKKIVDLKNLVEVYRSKDGSNYDCIIPVSGGKDSYFQTYFVKEILKLNPLLVTYNGNNYLDVGLKNLKNMREVFDCDHYFFTPGLETTKKLNRLGFKLTGDNNWHCHAGISTLPIIVATKFKVQLLIWGEHSSYLNGKNFISDNVEWTKRQRDEQDLRGFKIEDFIEETEKLTKKQLLFLQYPSDEEINSIGVRGIYLGNYVKWDGNNNYQIAKKYGFKIAEKPFQRTYNLHSNLDDMYENGLHDYLKFIKLGYGRATDHASKDIRLGKMTRDEGVEMVKKYDSVIPDDLYYWLDYVKMTEKEFWNICDTFRDPRVWTKKNNEWIKKNIWEEKK
jgi:N-acetyl sugar amidotransferase